MDKIVVTPRKIRGGKDILDSRNSREFINSKSTLMKSTSTINGSNRVTFTMHSAIGMNQYSVRDIMEIINTPLIGNIDYINGDIIFEIYDSNDITNMDELNQARIVYDLKYENGEISYEVFNSLSPYFYEEDLEILENAVTSLIYQNQTIIFEEVGEINV